MLIPAKLKPKRVRDITKHFSGTLRGFISKAKQVVV